MEVFTSANWTCLRGYILIHACVDFRGSPNSMKWFKALIKFTSDFISFN